MAKGARYATEAEMVAAFSAYIEERNERFRKQQDRADSYMRSIWTLYHETAGWDLLAVDQNGVQVGIEAKLTLNVKVLTQALPDEHDDEYGLGGPDYRAVLVEGVNATSGITVLARAVGLTTIVMGGYETGWPIPRFEVQASPDLPNENSRHDLRHWRSWLPIKRHELPDYVPDVMGGHAAPVALTQWKVKAIKLLILLERRGIVTRADMNALKISPTRWTDAYNGFLKADRLQGGYVRSNRTPDLKAQHPRNWVEIEADIEKWEPANSLTKPLNLAP